MTAVPVLLYHGVGESSDPWTVCWKRFSEDARALVDSGRTVVTVAEYVRLLRERASLERYAVISFDDGEHSQLAAAQHLAELGIPCSVYVTTSYLGRPGFLDERSLRELGQIPGVEVGSHSVDHVHLDVLSRPELARQVTESRHRLEDVLERAVHGIAYPHGSHNLAVLRASLLAGYTSGAAVKNALSHPDDLPMAVARSTVTARTRHESVLDLLAGQGRLGETRPRWRTRGFRVVRRARHRLRPPT